ncbi:hypothetical protein [Gemmatimonas sp.]|uniref:hypothetical protein n=1 Tax=Gemmatimonas sp. TaxID=1962908 RepID=UPI0037BEF68D
MFFDYAMRLVKVVVDTASVTVLESLISAVHDTTYYVHSDARALFVDAPIAEGKASRSLPSTAITWRDFAGATIRNPSVDHLERIGYRWSFPSVSVPFRSSYPAARRLTTSDINSSLLRRADFHARVVDTLAVLRSNLLMRTIEISEIVNGMALLRMMPIHSQSKRISGARSVLSRSL